MCAHGASHDVDEVGDQEQDVGTIHETKSEEIDELVRWADVNHVSCLGGNMLVFPDAFRAGEGTTLYGGSMSVFDANFPLLGDLGGRAIYVGDDPRRGAIWECRKMEPPTRANACLNAKWCEQAVTARVVMEWPARARVRDGTRRNRQFYRCR